MEGTGQHPPSAEHSTCLRKKTNLRLKISVLLALASLSYVAEPHRNIQKFSELTGSVR